MLDEEKLRMISGCGPDRRRMLCGFYGSMSEIDRVEAHRLAGELVRSLRSEAKPDDYFFYGVLIQALSKMHFDRHEAFSRKNSVTDEQAADIAEKRLASFLSAKADLKNKKLKKKAQWVEKRFFDLIKKLRGDGLSWRDISDYLLKYHQKKISHQYLKSVYEKNEK